MRKPAVTKAECYECVCQICDAEWTARGSKLPVRCPRCGKQKWQIPVDERRKPGRPRKEKI